MRSSSRRRSARCATRSRPIADVAARVIEWCRARSSPPTRRPTLVVDAALDGLEVAQRIVDGRARRSRVAGGKVPELARHAARPACTISGSRSELRRGDQNARRAELRRPRHPRGQSACPDRTEQLTVTALVAGRGLDGHAGHGARLRVVALRRAATQLLRRGSRRRGRRRSTSPARARRRSSPCSAGARASSGRRARWRCSRARRLDRAAAAVQLVDAVTRAASPIVLNGRDGGWWWRAPIIAVLWLAIAVPIITGLVVAHTLRAWSRDLPQVPDLAAWRAHAPQTTLILAADGSHLAELPVSRRRHRLSAIARCVLAIDAPAADAPRACRARRRGRSLPRRTTASTTRLIARAAYMNYEAGRTVEGASIRSRSRSRATCCPPRSATRAACSARCARRCSRARSRSAGPSARSSRPT